MNILIVEDDNIQSKALKSIISEYKSSWNILTAPCYDDAVRIYTENNIDLFFLDITLDNDSGRDGVLLAESIRLLENYMTTPIVFITAYKEQVYNAINKIHCYNYISKPFTKADIYMAIDDIEHAFLNTVDNLTIRDGNGIYIDVRLNSILYIEAARHMAIFHTCNSSLEHNGDSLKSILEVLDSRFIRIHKKYIININYLTNYDKSNQFITIRNYQLPVGRAYKKELENAIHAL